MITLKFLQARIGAMLCSGRHNPISRARTIAVALLLAAMGTGHEWIATISPVQAQPVCGVLTTCQGNTLTSSVTIGHIHDDTDPVEPNDTDTVEIEARWLSAFDGSACGCTDTFASVSVAVRWTGTTWTATCTGCNAVNGPIFAVNVCTSAQCQATSRHSWQYELIADIVDQVTVCAGTPARIAYLKDVNYAVTAADDGNILDIFECTEGASVTPVTINGEGHFAIATDSGPFECPFTCEDATGPSTTIFYD